MLAALNGSEDKVVEAFTVEGLKFVSRKVWGVFSPLNRDQRLQRTAPLKESLQQFRFYQVVEAAFGSHQAFAVHRLIDPGAIGKAKWVF